MTSLQEKFLVKICGAWSGEARQVVLDIDYLYVEVEAIICFICVIAWSWLDQNSHVMDAVGPDVLYLLNMYLALALKIIYLWFKGVIMLIVKWKLGLVKGHIFCIIGFFCVCKYFVVQKPKKGTVLLKLLGHLVCCLGDTSVHTYGTSCDITMPCIWHAP